MRHFFRSFLAWEMILCLVGMGACLVPTVPRTGAFWGLGNRVWTSMNPDRVHLLGVEANSPAAAGGLEGGDWVVEVNGRPATWEAFNDAIKQMEPGSEIRLVVERAGRRVALKGVGIEPQVEAYYYYDAQVVGLSACLALLLFLVATQPLRPAPWWRSLLVILVAFAGIVVLGLSFVGPLRGAWGVFTWVRFGQSWPIDNDPDLPRLAVQGLCLAVAVGLLVLGTLEVRAGVQRRVALRRQGEELVGLVQTTPGAPLPGGAGASFPGSDQFTGDRGWGSPPGAGHLSGEEKAEGERPY